MLRALMQNLNVPTVAPISHRSILSIVGSQASAFLNGIISSTVHEPGKPFFSAFLHAQGRVIRDVFIYTHTNLNGQRGYLVEYDSRPSEEPQLLSTLKRYVLRSKVKIRDVSEEYDVWAAWGSEQEQAWETPRNWNWAHSGVIEPVWNSEREWPWGTQEGVIRDRRAVGMGQRMLVRKGDRPQKASTHNVVSSEAYLLHRILHGVPEGIADIIPMQAFPMDSNLDVMGGLDFRKGCYVGQELTVRTYHTGVVRKRILPVVIHKPDERPSQVVRNTPPFPSNLDIRASILRAPDDNRPTPRPRGTGKLLSSSQGVGLALLRLEHVEGCQCGHLRLEFHVEHEGQKVNWQVSHWWPDWWPQIPNQNLN